MSIKSQATQLTSARVHSSQPSSASSTKGFFSFFSLRACLKIRLGAVFGEKAGWRGATKENIPGGSSTEEQRSQTAFSAKTLRAAGLLPVDCVGSAVTARCGDAPASPSCPQPKSPAAAPSPIFRQALETAVSAWAGINNILDRKTDPFIPAASKHEPESMRRARLICRFGFLGAFFGSVYGTFYMLIGHAWGALIVGLCSIGFALVPWLMKRADSLKIAGNVLSLILILGFFGLCCVEGGMKGHALAWLAAVPLCALLLLGRREAGRWMAGSFAACAVIVALNLKGVSLGPTYDPKWEALISAAGYLGFILFMFSLGVIFESGRKRAFGQLQDALASLEASNMELKHLNQEKSEFLAIAAHDLKNPLCVVIGTAELLKKPGDPARGERMLNNIIGAGTRMLRLVKNLLDANAIEEGRYTSKPGKCDLQAMARQCVENNRTSAAIKGITLQLETDAACWSDADPDATLQILDNLVSNALKYSPPNTTVHFNTLVQGGSAQVAVRDEGPGISEDDLKKLFGKFVRLTARPTGGESSNGLGLSIVKRLAESMAGTVRCKSQLERGATFILELPAWKEPPQKQHGGLPAIEQKEVTH